MTEPACFPIDAVPEGSLHGFNPTQQAQTPYRWSTPCSGLRLRIEPSVARIQLDLVVGSRPFNVWQDMDAFLGSIRLDHHHAAFDSTHGTLELSLPEALWNERDKELHCWLILLITPHMINNDSRSLGIAVTGISFIYAAADSGPTDTLHFEPADHVSFYRAVAALFDSNSYRHYLRDKVSTCAAQWSEQERRRQYEFSVYARQFRSRQAKLAFDAFMGTGQGLGFPETGDPIVSIIVVAFNRAELTYSCLKSILENTGIPCEVLLVDNASSDRTPELLDRVTGAKIILNQSNTGFLRGANQGADAARGEYLLFLNNDAEFLPGCVEAALNNMTRDNGVGAVGARLISMQGQLQEAGGILWNDGSTSHYGRGGRADAGEYMFKRPVDYCSGAFLFTRRVLFKELDGFDEVYAPGYYEDTDYCLRLRYLGYRVIYDPACAVLHHEYASGGDENAATGIGKNRHIFCDRHRTALAEALPSAYSNIIKMRSRHLATERTLIFGDFLPTRPDNPEFLQVVTTVTKLIASNHFVTIFASDQRPFAWEDIRRAIPDSVEVIPDMGWPQIGNFLAERTGYYDDVVICGDDNRTRFQNMVPVKVRDALRLIFNGSLVNHA